VSDLLIDRGGRVRYLAADLGLFRRSVLLPVEALEWGEETLVAPRWTADEIKTLPAYNPDVALSDEVLEELRRAHPRYYGGQDAPPPPVPTDGPRIVPLKEAKEFRLSKGAPNLRGWTVYGSDNERVGDVTEMLVDPVGMKIRYLDVDLADDLFHLKEDRHVLVPLESVDLRERGEDVWITTLTAKQVSRLPAYTGGAVDPLVEAEVRRVFGLEDGPGLFDTSAAEPPPIIDETAPPPSYDAPAVPAATPADAPPPIVDQTPRPHEYGEHPHALARDDRLADELAPPPIVDRTVVEERGEPYTPPTAVEPDAGAPPVLDERGSPPPREEGPPPLARNDPRWNG
jgi:photosynthetic reaction center H subunit